MGHTMALAVIPASRQKNCNACVQAKRRCDRLAPMCSRCVERKIACIYGKTRAAVSGPPRIESTVAAPCMENIHFGSSACSLFSPGLSVDLDHFGVMPMDYQPDAATVETIQPFAMDAASNDDTSMDPFTRFLDSSTTSNKSQWLVPTDHGSMIDRPNSPADEEARMAYQKMAYFCEYSEPSQLYDPKTSLHYVMNRVKGFTSDAVARNATPFMHRYLYKDHTPPCILECFSTNVLYANRTSTNMAMVMRALLRNVQELVRTENSRMVASPVEKLASTQALFLYQVIRLFDGDVTLRAQGEKDIPLLQTWLGELCRVRKNLGDLADLEDGATRAQPPKEWQRWIFAESVRRTIVMAYSVMTLYEMMKDSERTNEYDPWAYTHRWTLSRHLWEADSSFSFYRMWKEKPHYVINNYSFENFLKYGRGDDVDEFAEILLSVYVGVDETKEFISTQEIKR